MQKIGSQKIWSYFKDQTKVKEATNKDIRKGPGHLVDGYLDLVTKIAELQFMNRDQILFFRGQREDHKTTPGNSSLRPTIFRNEKGKWTKPNLEQRFNCLHEAQRRLIKWWDDEGLWGKNHVTRYHVIQWAILQHYEVCDTPLLDVTNSLRIATSFADTHSDTDCESTNDEAFVMVLGVPSLNGAVTTSSEAGLHVIHLSSVCPPRAVRAHVQEGYMLGQYPEVADAQQFAKYGMHELDFGKRLIAKFRFHPDTFWRDGNFPKVSSEALYPAEDQLKCAMDRIKESLSTNATA